MLHINHLPKDCTTRSRTRKLNSHNSSHLKNDDEMMTKPSSIPLSDNSVSLHPEDMSEYPQHVPRLHLLYYNVLITNVHDFISYKHLCI